MSRPALRTLRSKLSPPRLHRASIERSELVRAAAVTTSPVWLVSAPAGYGKTTFVAQATGAIDAEVAWVGIDRADNDPVRFWAHVAAAVSGDREVPDGFEPDPDALSGSVDEILAIVEARDCPLVLVLDDLHEIGHTGTLELLGSLVSRPPEGLTVVLVARNDPALPIGRLRAHGHLFEVRRGDLEFSTEEAAALLGAEPDDDAVAAVVERTEGWATSLQMLAVSSDGEVGHDRLLPATGGQDTGLSDFLAGEVLRHRDPEVQRFLVETSVLHDLEPELCDAVMGRPGCLAVLRDLESQQVFTELLDPVANTYRYHPLFRDFLRSRAEALAPERLATIHSVAARWNAGRDRPTEAIGHGMAAGDLDLVLATIKAHYLPYSQVGLLATVEEWLHSYGEERCRADPELRMAAAWIALNARRYDEVDQWLAAPAGVTDTERTRTEIHTIGSHRARHLGRLTEARSEADAALDLLADHSAPLGSVVCAVAGMARVLAGEPAEELLADALASGRDRGVESSVVIAYCYLALSASRDERQPSEADALADQALSHVTSPVLERFHQPAAALLVKAELALRAGRVADAAAHARRGERIAEFGCEPLLGALLQCCRARIAHRAGATAEVRAHLRAAEDLAGQDCGEWIPEVIRRASNDTRFAAVDPGAGLPGSVELTERERAVLALLPHRLPRRELAAQLFVSENTVKTQLTSIRHKLGVEPGADVVERAVELGMLTEP